MMKPPSAAAARVAEALARLQAGQVAQAAQLLTQVVADFPSDPEPALHLGLARRMAGDLGGALTAFETALARDPYFFMALFSKAAILEAMGRKQDAARDYANAFKIAPPDEALPAPIRAAMAKAKELVDASRRDKAAFLHRAISQSGVAAGPRARARIAETVDILAGVKKYFVHEPLLMTIPGLPTVGYFDRDLFEWLATLEAATPVIAAELEAAMARRDAPFEAYIQRPPGAPLNQWAGLNNNRAWSTLHLWRDGQSVLDAQELCPQTTALLQSLPMADQPGYAPTAMFSVMQPRTHIPPHTGSSNARAIVHLGLIVPEKCRFRVGNEVREWRVGEAFVFDDTIEHEAFNDSSDVRVVLIFDIWNPYLNAEDRALITALGAAMHAFGAHA
jgi:aspartyl/asparaginyl beta-hydroxylase (cupin superfamily)